MNVEETNSPDLLLTGAFVVFALAATVVAIVLLTMLLIPDEEE